MTSLGSRAVFSAAVAFGAAVVPPAGQAQSQVAAFDVATVKPTPEADRGDFQPSIVLFLPGGGFRRTNSTLRTLVRTAYGVQAYQVTGGPDWVDSDRFDVEARSGSNPNRDQTLRMLQTLLADRFKLQVRREVKEGPTYRLITAPTGAKLKSAETSTSADVRVGRYSGRRTLAQLADYLASIVGRPVTDQSRLSGIFEIALQFSPDPADPNGVSVFTALREQLGLQLEPARGPVDMLIIFGAQKPSAD